VNPELRLYKAIAEYKKSNQNWTSEGIRGIIYSFTKTVSNTLTDTQLNKIYFKTLNPRVPQNKLQPTVEQHDDMSSIKARIAQKAKNEEAEKRRRLRKLKPALEKYKREWPNRTEKQIKDFIKRFRASVALQIANEQRNSGGTVRYAPDVRYEMSEEGKNNVSEGVKRWWEKRKQESSHELP
jgi:hypothetical protein